VKFVGRDFEGGYHERFYYRESLDSQRNRERVRALLAHKRGGRLLEIGCGQGGFLRAAERHFDVEGIDISRSAIEGARARFGEQVRVGDVQESPLPRGCYDAIAAFCVFEHLRRPEEAVQVVYDALASGGVLFGTVPHNHGLVGGLNTRLGNFLDRTHVSTLTPVAWRCLFRRAGFGAVHFFGEVTLLRNHSCYLRGRLWPYLSFNLMFACSKDEARRSISPNAAPPPAEGGRHDGARPSAVGPIYGTWQASSSR
jgi:SAM-dependent methyltransferase